MCSSLANAGYEVSLIVADSKGNEMKDKVSIIDVGKSIGGRFSRITKTVKRIHEKAKKLDGDIYHLHDPELIPTGLKLKKLKKKIIFDAHEDLSKQILSKDYLNFVSKIALSKLYGIYERWSVPKFHTVISATPYIREKLLKLNSDTVDINNFPLLDEFKNSSNYYQKENEIVYIGGLSKIRGIEELVASLSFMKKVKLNLVGRFNDNQFMNKIKSHKNWDQVKYLGFLDRHGVKKVLDKSKIGVVTLYPKTNYLDSLPVKMFEYMSAGLPIVASNFPLWKSIVEDNNCGICVDPFNIEAISDAINYLLDNPISAEKMGKNGINIIKKKYNWQNEEKKLLQKYKSLI
jgi:glycosyltransferase involved in cell wall biosynthesis